MKAISTVLLAAGLTMVGACSPEAEVNVVANDVASNSANDELYNVAPDDLGGDNLLGNDALGNEAADNAADANTTAGNSSGNAQ